MIKLKLDIGGLKLNNPVIAASGTFGFGREFSEYVDINRLGGISVKGLSLKPKAGNKPPRIAETPAGILNSVGLQNPGVDSFIKDEIPFLKQYRTAIIANATGNTNLEYCRIIEILSDADIDAIEMNVSCPNVKKGCMAFGSSVHGLTELLKEVKPLCKKPLIVKLTPNVTDIVEIAKAAEYFGADMISLINTVLGMTIDIKTRKPVLRNNYGGLSGPAVKPIAVRMVHQVYSNVSVPVIGMGGIQTGEDAIEFMLAGASAVMVGTQNFVNPVACTEVLDGIIKYMEENSINELSEITGKVEIYDD
jgi:dihydroorotate dehydrogenase (NAD+) catalytic subunit